jgi:hypothetical protein
MGPTQHRIQWMPGVLCLGVKRLGSGVDQSPLSAEVKNKWSYTSTSCIRPHGVHRDDFISPFGCSEKYTQKINNTAWSFLMLEWVVRTVTTGI